MPDSVKMYFGRLASASIFFRKRAMKTLKYWD